MRQAARALERGILFKTNTADDPTLAEAVCRVVAAYQPERVYLFGSVARGDAGPDSDYDLLVVVPDDAPPELPELRPRSPKGAVL